MSTKDDVYDLDYCLEGNARIAEGCAQRLKIQVQDITANLEAGKRRRKEHDDLMSAIKDAQDVLRYLTRVQGMLVAQKCMKDGK